MKLFGRDDDTPAAPVRNADAAQFEVPEFETKDEAREWIAQFMTTYGVDSHSRRMDFSRYDMAITPWDRGLHYSHEYIPKSVMPKFKAAVAAWQAIHDAEVDAKLAVYKDDDRQQQSAAQTFSPEVKIVDRGSGKFLVYDNHSFPLRFIESIDVTDTGEAPHLGCSYHFNTTARKATSGTILLTMSSGRNHTIAANRHEIEVLHDALSQAWRTGESVNVD